MAEPRTVVVERKAERPAAAPVARSLAKRAIDIVAAVLALLFLAPLMLLTALAVKLDSRGPALFRQRRTGLGGEPFMILKFRTMTVMEDGEALAHATKADARVTRLGGFLRKSSLDELPQLINILKGDMSLVGPRPHALAHDRLYQAQLPEYAERFRARPGLTGLAQISGLRGEIHDIDCMRRRVAADNAYVDDWRLTTDLRIVLKTIPLIFSDPTAY